MKFIARWQDWGFLIIGICLIVSGFTAKRIIDEETPVTEEERDNAHPTPLKRAAVIGAGLIAVIWSIVLLSR